MPGLRRWIRFAVAAGATLALGYFIHTQADAIRVKLDARAKELDLEPGFDWLNPFSWAKAPKTIAGNLEIYGMAFQYQAATLAFWATVAIGSGFSLYFLWNDVIASPEALQLQRQVLLGTGEAVRAAAPGVGAGVGAGAEAGGRAALTAATGGAGAAVPPGVI